MARRRLKGEGSIYQTHGKDCPPVGADGTRPRHTCKGRWTAYIDHGWVDGKRQRQYVTGPDKATVRRKLDEAKAAATAGIRSDATTVRAWVTYWVQDVAPTRCAASTLARYQSCIATWIVPSMGAKRLAAVRPADLRALYARMEGEGLSGSSRRNVHAVLHRAFKVAVQDGVIPWNPAERVDAPTSDKGRRHAELSTDESLRVLAACTSVEELARAAVALLTGLRQGEALGLAWADVDLNGGSLRVRQVAQRAPGQGVVILPRIKAGAGEERWVALLPEVVQTLRSWRAETGGTGLVFGHPDDRQRPRRPEGDHREWKALCRRAGVPEVPLHGARASTSTRLQELGVPLHIVADVLGHADLAVTAARYTRSNLDAQRAALASLPQIELPVLPGGVASRA